MNWEWTAAESQNCKRSHLQNLPDRFRAAEEEEESNRTELDSVSLTALNNTEMGVLYRWEDSERLNDVSELMLESNLFDI